MNVGSLFSGIGGIELGFERAGGFNVKWFIEKDLYCQAVLKKHWPNVPVYGDIKQIDFKALEPVDILTGGFPCQDISIAGKGAGINGSRSGLWKEYLRAIGEIRPRFVFVENVSMLRIRGLDVVLGDLAALGYDAEWYCLSARDVGALHKRERLFIIAYSSSNGLFKGFEKGKRIKFKGKSGGLQEFKGNDLSGFLLANDFGERVSRFRKKSLQGKQGFSRFQNVGGLEDLRNRRDIPEPLLCRGNNRVPCWVDRIKCVGNAVVPQCAEFFAEIIKEKAGLVS